MRMLWIRALLAALAIALVPLPSLAQGSATSSVTGVVVDVSGGSTADGANIIQESYSGSDSQLWRTSILSTPLPIPPTPTDLTATAASISQINLSWTASSSCTRSTKPDARRPTTNRRGDMFSRPIK